MGFTYSNITLKGPAQEQLVAYLRDRQRDAYVSPTVNGITVVYDRECEDLDEAVLHAVTADLSRAFDCPALAAYMFDDDVFWYTLYQRGQYLDTYNSSPNYFDDSVPSDPSGGNAELLCTAFDCGQATGTVATLLHVAAHLLDDEDEQDLRDDYLQGEDLHRALADALGLPSYTSSMGYYSAGGGNVPKGAQVSLLVKTLP